MGTWLQGIHDRPFHMQVAPQSTANDMLLMIRGGRRRSPETTTAGPMPDLPPR
ncbi:hypothetical protein ABE488_09720 [Luteimonas sp. TWI662]|uniref:hypothetical protein n=1 Tax=Luteimonas sp. TWI662 TaxID=3136789 RepID=UPI0032090623